MNEGSKQQRVIVITGASRGLGAEMAEFLLGQGHRLGLCARGPLLLEGREGVFCGRVDVRDDAAVAEFADGVAAEHGPIDLWINNAGVLDPIRFVHDLETSAMMDHLAINIGGVLAGSRVYARQVRRRDRGGVLVNISSGAALKGYAGWAAYCAGKAAVDRLTECVQLEEAEHGLRAYAVAPGVIDTGMQATIRGTDAAQFPAVKKFLDLKEREAFNGPAYVARQLMAIAFEPDARPSSVVVRLADDPERRD